MNRESYVKKQEAWHTKGKYYPRKDHSPALDRTPVSVYKDMEKEVRRAMDNTNWDERLQILKDLYPKVHGASKPYISLLINKTLDKIEAV